MRSNDENTYGFCLILHIIHNDTPKRKHTSNVHIKFICYNITVSKSFQLPKYCMLPCSAHYSLMSISSAPGFYPGYLITSDFRGTFFHPVPGFTLMLASRIHPPAHTPPHTLHPGQFMALVAEG